MSRFRRQRPLRVSRNADLLEERPFVVEDVQQHMIFFALQNIQNWWDKNYHERSNQNGL